MPVWFMGDNPIVGCKASSKYVTLLFRGGRPFGEPALIAAGRLKAAQIKSQSIKDLDVTALRRWLRKSKLYARDYQNIRKNAGELKRVWKRSSRFLAWSGPKQLVLNRGKSFWKG
jgi:hypothetical protein